MSHTLHRTGEALSLGKDYVILVMPENGLNDQDSEHRLRVCYEILLRHHPVNTGDSKNGSRYSLGSDQLVRDALEEKETIFAVYENEADLTATLRDLREADQGLSVVVSGLFSHTCKCAREAGLTPHTAAESLGVWGKTSLLPENWVQDISTMCGHGLISYNLVRSLADQVKHNRLTPIQAGEKLAKCCICGVFNPVRAAEIITSLIP